MFVLLRFIASIFYQILYMSILASVIGLIILLIQKIINRRISPQFKYFIWFSFVIMLIFPISIPSRISIYNYININEVKLVNTENVDYINNILENEDKDNLQKRKFNICLNNTNVSGMDSKVILANVLLIISILKIFISIYSYYLLIKSFENENVIDKRILDIIDECKRELNIKRNIKIINQNIANSPAIIGIFNVNILFTEKLNLCDDTDLKNMFLHELSHYKRKDNYVIFIIMILEALYWFNPIVMYMFKYIKREMEFATDELAIKNMNVEQTRAYCKSIIDAEERRSTKIIPILAFAGELEYIEKRIDFISLKSNFKRFSKIIFFFALFIMLGICLIFYPTSYGIMNLPELYLQTDDGRVVELKNIDKNDMILNDVEVKKNSNAKLIIKNVGTSSYIYSSKISTKNNFTQEKETIMLDNNIVCFEEGEYLYNFMLVNENKRTSNYGIKIIVK